MTAAASLADHWEALAAGGLLGTDRRGLVPPPPGPAAHLAEHRVPAGSGEGLLDQVALLTALRRAGVRPGPPRPLLLGAPVDDRPPCSERAVAVLGDILAEWPVLLDEWLAALLAGGKRLPADLVVPLLGRFRADPRRRAAVMAGAGSLADWLVELFPTQLVARRPSPAAESPLPPLPPDIARLAELDGPVLAATLAEGLARAELTNRLRPLLVRLVCTVPAGHLAPCAAALHRAGTHPATMGLALGLAELATLRHTMIQELLP